MDLTESELRYYSGNGEIMEYPIWMLAKGDVFLAGPPANGDCPINSVNETTGLLSPLGISYMRNKWALRLIERYKTDISLLSITRETRIPASEDFARFWRFNTSKDIIDAIASYNSMRELDFVPGYDEHEKRPYGDNRWTSIFPCLKTQWAKREADGFGELFETFHFNHADMEFVDIVISYISILPYCWLMREGSDLS